MSELNLRRGEEPVLEKETPLEGQEQLSEKEMKWKDVEQGLEKYSGIENGIKETIVGLNAFDVETVNSCEGHFNHGRIAPWASMEKWESKPREKYVGQKEFEQEFYKKLGVEEINESYAKYLKEYDEKAAEFLLMRSIIPPVSIVLIMKSTSRSGSIRKSTRRSLMKPSATAC